jgi:site-specific recombinase XerD
MLTIFRRHTDKCSYTSRDERRCNCPINADWYLPDGTRVQKSLGIRDWQAAQRRAREMEADGIVAASEAVTIKKATDDFLADAQTTIKSTTVKQYRIILSKLVEYSQQQGLVFLKQLGVVQVREFRASWTTYSPRTAGKHVERLKRFFNWCVENHWLDSSPAKPLKSPKVGDTDVVPFTEEEVEKVSAACEAYGGPNRDRLVVLTNLMLATGLAIGDAATISKKRVTKNTKGYSVELRRAKTGAPVCCPIRNELAKEILNLDNDTPFWSGASDLEDITKNWRNIYSKVFETAGVDGHPHQFRHTAAKRWLIDGLSISHVASLLGDSEAIVRKHYSKWIPERQEALENAVRATWKG